MAQIKGIINAKGKSGEIIANNGAYFVDLTNATESSGTYTIPSADIENGDFTLQVGDTLIDKDSGSMLKVATLTPGITATLVFEASGGGKQLYQHNIKCECITDSQVKAYIALTIINDSNDNFTISTLLTWLSAKGFDTKQYCASGAFVYKTGSSVYNLSAYGIQAQGNSFLRVYGFASITGDNYTAFSSVNITLIDTVIAL